MKGNNMAEKNRIIQEDNFLEKDYSLLSDNDLVFRVQKGRTELFGIVIERYQGKLFAYLYRLIGNQDEAQDLLQDVFIKAFRNMNSYDVERKFSSWIYRIAHNEAINHLKRKSLRRFISWEDIVSTRDKLMTSETEDGADKAWLRKEIINEVDQVINKLPSKYKQVLLLRYYSEKSYEEISEILQKPINTVGTLINRAKKKMNKEVEKNKKKFNLK
jgi:RNA polymerase sigma-70 factor (ECF subfamily)